MTWEFVKGQKRHTQDGCQLVELVKSVGHGRRPCVAVDVGCGDGIIAHDLLVKKRATRVVAFDIHKAAVAAAHVNLAPYIEAGCAAVFRQSASVFFREKKNWDLFDRFIINPPFFVHGSGQANKSGADQIARHDKSLALSLWTRGAHRLLKTGGELYCVFPTERLAELMLALSSNEVEPKELWWLKADLRKRRVFVRAVRGARPGVIVHFDHSI